ncbi:hypothetical protein GW17_00016249 [Ensete ventricosum]|nr:hypothetical protein GW17_00016249 [Ensete ventricosum]RZS04027.1 hypothetical protein BHM03_00034292 [Ensete ventricosum]
MDKVSQRSKGFGFVTFASEDEAQKAVAEMNGKGFPYPIRLALCVRSVVICCRIRSSPEAMARLTLEQISHESKDGTATTSINLSHRALSDVSRQIPFAAHLRR